MTLKRVQLEKKSITISKIGMTEKDTLFTVTMKEGELSETHTFKIEAKAYSFYQNKVEQLHKEK